MCFYIFLYFRSYSWAHIKLIFGTYVMRDTILKNKEKSYSVHYNSQNTNDKNINPALLEIRSYFISSIYKALKSFDLTNLTIRNNQKIKLDITIQKDKIEMNY